LETDEPFSIKNVALFKYYSRELTEPRFVKIFTESLAFRLQSEASGGAQPFVSLGYLRNLFFGLPPIAEQKRIVAKVQELMKFSDMLRARAIESEIIKIKVANAVVEKVVS